MSDGRRDWRKMNDRERKEYEAHRIQEAAKALTERPITPEMRERLERIRRDEQKG